MRRVEPRHLALPSDVEWAPTERDVDEGYWRGMPKVGAKKELADDVKKGPFFDPVIYTFFIRARAHEVQGRNFE